MADEVREARESVALGSRVLGAAGLDDFVWGHVSARDPHGRGIWIKQSGIGLSEVRPERVHLVSPEGEVLEGEGPRHIEYPIHTEIMRARPDVGAVVHVHGPDSIALAAAGIELRPVGHAGSYFTPPQVPCFDGTSDLIASPELGRAVAETLGDRPAVFLLNHGSVAVGPDIPTAVFAGVLLEEACRQMARTVALGGSPRWTPDHEALVKRDRIYSPAAVATAWEYLVRRLG